MKTTLTVSVLLSLMLMVGCTPTTPPTHQASVSNNIAPPDPDAPKVDAPLTANIRFAAGQVAESQGDFHRAITQYEAAFKLDHTASVPLLRLGMIYTQLGQFDDAVNAWNRYIKATNGDASGYCDLGYTLELAQRFNEAEGAYKTAIAREPRKETARVDYGLMLARRGRMKEATEQLQTVLTPAEVHYNLASVLESEGKKEDARFEYEQALKFNPQMIDAQSRLAAINLN
jgi:tetratricopeptide (TPR) repeat protein